MRFVLNNEWDGTMFNLHSITTGLLQRSVNCLLVAGLTAASLTIPHAPARATEVLASFTGGGSQSCPCINGQSVTTPGGGPYDDIQFNFLDYNGNPIAQGTLYVFSSAYTGSPSGLSSSAYLGASVSASGGVYSFNPSFELQGATQYFFYEDTAFGILGYGGGGAYSGGNQYYSGDSGIDFVSESTEADFTLAGVSAVPEPDALLILSSGLGILPLIRSASRRPARPGATAWRRKCAGQTASRS